MIWYLRLKKYLISNLEKKICYSFPFEITWTEDKPRTTNPEGRVLAKFRYKGKIWVMFEPPVKS